MRFTVRSPAQRLEGSPRCHGTPCRDIPGRVHVSVSPVPTGNAPEDRLALTALRRAMPARMAGLRRERGTDLLHPTGRLVLQAYRELAPTTSEDGPVQNRLLPHTLAWTGAVSLGGPGHVLYPQVFDTDQIESTSEIGAGLLHPVLPPINATRLQTRYGCLDLLPPYVARTDGDLAESLMLTGLAPGRAAVGTTKKIRHRLLKVSQRLLLHRHRSISKPGKFGAGDSQLPSLLHVARRRGETRPPVPMLLNSEVPHVPRVSAVHQQTCLLGSRGQQPKARHLTHTIGSHRQHRPSTRPTRISRRQQLSRRQQRVVRQLESK